MTPPAPPPPRRRLALTLAAIGCWLVAAHAVIVPGVIGFTLGVLCAEEGWGNVLGSTPGLILLAMTGASLGSTVAFTTAGFAYYRSRSRSGHRQMIAGVGLALITAALIWSR